MVLKDQVVMLKDQGIICCDDQDVLKILKICCDDQVVVLGDRDVKVYLSQTTPYVKRHSVESVKIFDQAYVW